MRSLQSPTAEIAPEAQLQLRSSGVGVAAGVQMRLTPVDDDEESRGRDSDRDRDRDLEGIADEATVVVSSASATSRSRSNSNATASARSGHYDRDDGDGPAEGAGSRPAAGGVALKADDVPPIHYCVLMGLQHYVTMFGGTLSQPFVIADALGIDSSGLALLICTVFFVSGICTVLQTTLGNRLPIVQGGTFTFLSPAISILNLPSLAGQPWQVKMRTLQGAIICGVPYFATTRETPQQPLSLNI
ncbi:xanthine permease [Pelomyxa schiedti]|nr:xanthine permease [Pelomyxa schiedti]